MAACVQYVGSQVQFVLFHRASVSYKLIKQSCRMRNHKMREERPTQTSQSAMALQNGEAGLFKCAVCLMLHTRVTPNTAI